MVLHLMLLQIDGINIMMTDPPTTPACPAYCSPSLIIDQDIAVELGYKIRILYRNKAPLHPSTYIAKIRVSLSLANKTNKSNNRQRRSSNGPLFIIIRIL